MSAEPSSAGHTDAAADRPIEIELKFRPVSLAAGERVLRTRELAGLGGSTRSRRVAFEDRYVDTAGGAIAAAGFAARLRTLPESTLISLKSLVSSGSGAVQRRQEIEGPADPDRLPADWPASDARALVLELAGDEPLVERLTIRQQRRRRRISDDAAVLELSLDEVTVLDGGEPVDQWVELEIELVEGDEDRLLAVAAALAGDPELEIVHGAKLDRALAATALRVLPEAASEAAAGEAMADAPPKRRKGARPAPKTPGVSTDDTVAEAGRKTLRFHFDRMLAREAGTRDGQNIADLHGMRVATRRMRAAWRIFGSGFRPGDTRRIRRRLRDVARRLGDVRDLDVLLEGLDAYRADLPAAEQRALQPLADMWLERRDEARVRLLAELDSVGYTTWVETYRVFLHTPGAGAVASGPIEPHHVRDTAPSRILAAYEAVRAYEPVMRWADVETLHELRIAAKWLRYSLEFVREPLGPEVEALVPRVVAVQDHLGWMHDADVAAGQARQCLVERATSMSSEEGAAIGRYLVSREREVARLRRTIGRPWRGVAGLPFRRRLGRAVANL